MFGWQKPLAFSVSLERISAICQNFMALRKPTKKTASPDAALPAAEIVTKPARKNAATKSPAATHKQAAPRAAAARSAKTPARRPAFDPSLHHEEIACEAYFLWEARGHAHGHEAEDWFHAVETVRARYA